MEIRRLDAGEIAPALFAGFDRRQEVNLCWRRGPDGSWEVRPDPFTDDWTAKELADLIADLAKTAACGGAVFAAFTEGRMAGFCSLSGKPSGSRGQYRDLTNLHVSRESRGQGIGRQLFAQAAAEGRRMGGERLYLSAHSADETQRFYRNLGCCDAEEIIPAHVKAEPFDCQLEFLL